MSFRLTSGATGRILICQPPGEWGKGPSGAGALATDANILIDNKPMPLADDDFLKQHAMSNGQVWLRIAHTLKANTW